MYTARKRDTARLQRVSHFDGIQGRRYDLGALLVTRGEDIVDRHVVVLAVGVAPQGQVRMRELDALAEDAMLERWRGHDPANDQGAGGGLAFLRFVGKCAERKRSQHEAQAG